MSFGGVGPIECAADPSAACDDDNDCTTDVCELSGCKYLELEDGTACDDGVMSTRSDVCLSGVCRGVIPGDVDRDGCVDDLDYDLLSQSYNRSVEEGGADPRADFNGDGWVDVLDYLILYDNWLEGC